MSRPLKLAIAAVVAAIALGAAAHFYSQIREGRKGVTLRLAEERDAPLPLRLETREGVVESSQWLGRPVLVAVWAAWCGPCIQEIPLLIDLQQRHATELTVVGLNVDSEGWPAVERIRAAFPGINYVIALPQPKPLILGTIVNLDPLGQVSVLPTAFLLDGQGRLAAKYVGSEAAKSIAGDIDTLLAE